MTPRDVSPPDRYGRGWSCRILFFACAIASLTPDRDTRAAAVAWAEGCMPFIPPAEQYYHLPQGLLRAIALTESGRDGAPYPWALNIAGQTVIAPTYQAAAGLLRRSDGVPRQDVAVGCMQIHMLYHLDHFVEPEWALHPRYNVWYAAGFLDALRRRYGTMAAAVAHYHGSDPAAQRGYLCRVAAHLAVTAPATRDALGLGSCAAETTVERPYRAMPARQADALMAARHIGRIIVLGEDRP